MKLGKKFNTLTSKEYLHVIENHKKYTDFNTLGLYRSILENGKLDTVDKKMEILKKTNEIFQKSFDFLQIKDPYLYFKLITLDCTNEMTVADENQIWNDIHKYQEKYLTENKNGHRNFGIHSKHSCGNKDCPYNGLMIKQGSPLTENCITFNSDKPKPNPKYKKNKISLDLFGYLK